MIRNAKTQRDELFWVLLDSGTNWCMGTTRAVQRAGLHVKTGRQHRYRTAAGTFMTTQSTRIRAHKLLELNSQRILQRTKVQVAEGELGVYDFIFGRDYMNRYGIDLLFSEGVIQWDGMQMPMKETAVQEKPQRQEQEEEGETSEEDEWSKHFAQHILDAKYEKQDLLRVAKDQIHLKPEQRMELHSLLEKYQSLFQGDLGEWPNEEVSVELTADAIPYHCGKPIRIPHVHLETLKKEVQ